MTSGPARYGIWRLARFSGHVLALGILISGTVLTGCAVDQEKEVAKYRAVLDADTRGAQDVAPGASISLTDALELANQHNERLTLQGEDYLQALIDKDRAFSNFLPTISLAPMYSVQDKAGGGNGGSSRRDRTDVPVEGSINLFNGFRDWNQLRRTAFTLEQQRALLLDLRATVLLDVAQAYYNVLRAEQSVEVLRNSLAVQEERVRDIRGRQRAGVARPLDVSLIESQAAETRTTLIRALRDVENARSILSFLIDADARDGALTDKFDLPVDAPSLEQFFQLALAQRQDLLAAIANIDAARRAVDEAVGQYYPSVSLDVDYFLSRQSTPTESDWSALLRANLPIFSAGRIQADVRTAWSRLRQAALAENLTRRQVIQDVEVAYQNVASSGETLAELQVQLAAQQEALRQAEASYNAGLGTNLERLVAQDALLTTQLELANEQYDQKVFYLNLQRAAGRLGTDPATPLVVAPTTRVSDDAHVHR